MERKVHTGNKWWKITTIYSKERKKTRRRVEDAMKENREDRILLRGDFNGRIGERRARNREEERGDGKRKSKDKVENAEGKQRRKGLGDRNKTVYFYFFGIAILSLEKM
jgi:hypothetical protein